MLHQLAAPTPALRDTAAFIRESTPGADLIHVYGEVDQANASELETTIGLPHMVGRPLRVDLSFCSYMDSTGLTVLVRAKKRFGGDFRVQVHANPSMERLLKISSLDQLLI